MTVNGKSDQPEYPNFIKPYLSAILAKIPSDWTGESTRKGDGWRWYDPQNRNNQVRIDPGRPEISMQTQQTDHVVVNYHGTIIGKDGKPILEGVKSDPANAHIPLSEWLSWKTWYSPEGKS